MNNDINIVNGIVTGVQIGSPMQDATPIKPEDNEKYFIERNNIASSKYSKEALEKLPEPIGGASSWDDLEDKPFYATESQLIIYDGTLTFSEMDGLYGAPLTLSLDSLKPYTVVFDGTIYENVGRQFNGITVLGNLKLIGGEDTGEPFIWVSEGSGMLVSSVDGESHTVTIYTVSEDVYKLDRKFLPTLESIPYNNTDYGYVTLGAIKNYYFPLVINADRLKTAVEEMQKGVAQIYINNDRLLSANIADNGDFYYVNSILTNKIVPLDSTENQYAITLGTTNGTSEIYMQSFNGTRYRLYISDAGELQIVQY